MAAMTSTDELRRLLDERGVEYKSHYLNTYFCPCCGRKVVGE